jgi:hypothetical protein
MGKKGRTIGVKRKPKPDDSFERQISELFHGPGGGMRTEQVELMQRVYAGLSLRDADANVLINVRGEDIAGAVRNDTEHCVFARSCQRLFESHHLVFMKSIAYLDIVCEDGVRRVLRFEISDKMAEAIKRFDETGVAETGNYTLCAPRKSYRLENKTRYNRRHVSKPGVQAKKSRKARERRAKLKATGIVPFKKTINRAGVIGVVRSGQGLIQTAIVKNGGA